MKYDIFISYSRKDSAEVNSLISRLRREIPGIKIWFDIEGVESADEFKRKIISAIDDSNIVLFACSDNSLASEYCEKEVAYAKNIGKKVLPYLLEGSQLKGWLLFDFGNINCIHSGKADEVTRMINDLMRWSQHQNNLQNSSNNPVNQQTNNNLESQLVFDPVSGEFKQNNSINGHQYVDLGLPSGLKWATTNIGAKNPEESGVYFAWGDPIPQPMIEENNCITFNKDNQWLKGHGYIWPNGCLTLAHDAARMIWGGRWRMPTLQDVEELIMNTTIQWSVLNGVKGCLVKSKRNGKTLFLPACGWKTGDSVKGSGIFGYYWTSQSDESNPSDAYGFYFTMSTFLSKAFDRSCGRLIRPVSE